jgi:hypothetical protein
VATDAITRVWGDSVDLGWCRARNCGAIVTFARQVTTERVLMFDGDLVALTTTTDVASGRAIWTVDATSHLATCPAVGWHGHH